MSIKSIDRSILPIPYYRSLPGDIRSRLNILDRRLKLLPEDGLRGAKEISRCLFELNNSNAETLNRLEHPLSKYARHMWCSRDPRWDPADEYNASKKVHHVLYNYRLYESHISSLIFEEIASICNIPFTSFRKVPVFTKPDSGGGMVRYPDANRIDAALCKLINHVIKDESPSIWRSICILAGILNIHPFLDGNGRVSRVCFNAILEKPYIPLWAIWACSRGGFQLSIREAEIKSDWLALIVYFESVADVLHNLHY